MPFLIASEAIKVVVNLWTSLMLVHTVLERAQLVPNLLYRFTSYSTVSYASLFVGGLGVACAAFGLVCFVAAWHWRLDKVGYWWAWLGPAVLFLVVGCVTVWKS